jgi:phenylpropionate dioxygenase-like ring-hydroxylating dioxygenase large terminal subunit
MMDALVLDEWYPVAIADRLAPGEERTTRLLGTDIRIARESGGALRGATAGGGSCELMERYGFVWATLGRPSRAFFEIPEFSDGLGRRFVPWGAIGVHTSAARAIENFLDLAHFPYVHNGTLGTEAETEVADYKVELDQATDELWARECKFFQPKAAAALSAGSVIDYRYRVVRPFAALFYKSAVLYPDRDNVSGLFVQPVEEEYSIGHAFSYVFNPDGTEVSIRHFAQEIFAQDRPILLHQWPKKLPLDSKSEKPTRADRMSVAYRDWLSRAGFSYGVIRSPA